MKMNIAASLVIFFLLMIAGATTQAQTTPSSSTITAAAFAQSPQVADRFQSTIAHLEAEVASNGPRAQRAAFELYVIKETGGNYITMNERVALEKRYVAERTRSMRVGN